MYTFLYCRGSELHETKIHRHYGELNYTNMVEKIVSCECKCCIDCAVWVTVENVFLGKHVIDIFDLYRSVFLRF